MMLIPPSLHRQTLAHCRMIAFHPHCALGVVLAHERSTIASALQFVVLKRMCITWS